MSKYPNPFVPLIFALLLLACTESLQKQAVSPKDKIDELLKHCYDNGMFNGTILVALGDSIIYREALGYSDFESDLDLTEDSRFYLASVSKQFTTMAIMLLKEQGKLNYEDKLSSFFDDFPSYADDITIRHMMTHTSGIPDQYRLGAYKPGLNNQDVYKLLIQQDTLDFEPGSQYRYSNGGYVLLSMIVEKVTKQTYADFMETNIFNPLSMSNTLVYDTSAPFVPSRAIGFNAEVLDDYEIFTTGAGGMFSNIDDLYKWHKALQNNQLVSLETIEEAYEPYVMTSGDTSFYGFGWALQPEENAVSHSGGMNGYRTYIKRYLATGDAFIYLTNNGDALNFDIVDQLHNAMIGEEVIMPKIPISSFIGRNLTSDNADSLIDVSIKLLRETEEYSASERQINVLGYSYLEEEQLSEAKAVFAFNKDYFPNSANVYDSYGEVLLASGDTSGAIVNYKQSVQNNPNNQNGIDVLERLGVIKEQYLEEVNVDVEQLEQYVGTFDMEGEFTLSFSLRNDTLFVTPSGEGSFPIYPASTTRFYVTVTDAQVTFQPEEDGTVNTIVLHQNGDMQGIRTQ